MRHYRPLRDRQPRPAHTMDDEYLVASNLDGGVEDAVTNQVAFSTRAPLPCAVPRFLMGGGQQLALAAASLNEAARRAVCRGNGKQDAEQKLIYAKNAGSPVFSTVYLITARHTLPRCAPLILSLLNRLCRLGPLRASRVRFSGAELRSQCTAGSHLRCGASSAAR